MADYVVLLRAINVGGHNKIKMAELRELLEELKFTRVSTYLQSGNVVCSSRKQTAGVATSIAAGIRQRFGHDIVVIVRTADEFGKIIDACPFPEPGDKSSSIVFLDETYDGTLDASAFAPDKCVHTGSEVYLHWHGDFSTTKLTPSWIEKQTGRAGTRRNWATLRALRELVSPE